MVYCLKTGEWNKMVFICDHCHHEMEAGGQARPVPGLWEGGPHPCRHTGGKPRVPGPEAGGRVARSRARHGRLRTKSGPGSCLARAVSGAVAVSVLLWVTRGFGGSTPALVLRLGLVVRLLLGLTGADRGGVGAALGVGLGFRLRQSLLNEPHHELPLGEFPAQSGALPVQVGLDALKKFFSNLKGHRPGFPVRHDLITPIFFQFEVFRQQIRDVLAGGLARLLPGLRDFAVQIEVDLSAEVFCGWHGVRSFRLIVTQVYSEGWVKAITSVDFHFRGAEYHVDFVGADIFPQGFAAVADHLRGFRGMNMLADIGNGTMMSCILMTATPRRKSASPKNMGPINVCWRFGRIC